MDGYFFLVSITNLMIDISKSSMPMRTSVYVNVSFAVIFIPPPLSRGRKQEITANLRENGRLFLFYSIKKSTAAFLPGRRLTFCMTCRIIITEGRPAIDGYAPS